MKKFKVGDKVVAHSKSVGCPLSRSLMRDREYLYITSVRENYYTCDEKEDGGTGDYFLESELSLYKEAIVYTKEYLENNEVIVNVRNEEEHNTLKELDVTTHEPYDLSYKYSFRLYPEFGFGRTEYYPESSMWNYWKFIEASEVINSLKTKEINTEMKKQTTPKVFAIKGKESILECIMEDLLEIGYTRTPNVTNLKRDVLVNNKERIKTREDYKDLYIGRSSPSIDTYKQFTLPQDYEAALRYAKEALNDASWPTNYIEGDIVVFTSVKQGGPAEVGDFGKLLKKKEDYHNSPCFEVEHPHGSNSYSAEVFRLATPEEVKKYEESCIILHLGSNNKEVRITKGKILSQAEVNIEDVKELIIRYTNRAFGKLYNIGLDEDMRCIRIGCHTENNLFSLNELVKVVEAYNKVNYDKESI